MASERSLYNSIIMSAIKPKTRFLLVGIQSRKVSDQAAFGTWRELWQLVESYGGQVVDVIIQKREVHDKGMYIGQGKLADVKQAVVDQQIDAVVLHDVVKPGQLYDMQLQLTQHKPQLEVWDRVDLILQIFSQHAHTAEARLQIELASMRHMGPRIYGMGSEMSRQGGGIGTRGIGETNTERMKRHWAAQMKKVEDKLTSMSQNRQRQLQHRQRQGLPTMSLIGYTNAGKTSLYNSLVGKHKFTQDMLFATLDASVGRLYLPEINRQILLSDTIGFIQGLPPQLLEAFTSTLMESVYADLLLHVIDASDQRLPEKLAAVDQVLHTLHLDQRPQIFVFNKIDQSNQDVPALAQKYAEFTPQFVSATTGQGIDKLIETIGRQLERQADIRS